MDVNNDDHSALIKDALLQIKALKTKLAVAEGKQVEPIAIIGLGCRFPGGADTPEKFWQLLEAGADLTSDVPDDRQVLDTYYAPMAVDGQGNSRPFRGGFVSNVASFDAQFFGIAPREATALDPQQRLLLEVSWEALESAGIVPGELLDSPTGVFVGLDGSDLEGIINSSNITIGEEILYYMTGTMLSLAAGRLSYTLGLTGPCIVTDTACSSSLVTVHQACQSLRNRECDLALAGGVNLILRHEISGTSEGSILSPDGHCKTFDAAADGFSRGEGCGLVVLKRMSDALADGDTILSVIRGSMINQDGRSSGLTAPSGVAQQAVIRKALKAAGIKPDDVDFIETHGTGTMLGDPIEIGALSTVFQGRTEPLWVGSVKTNMGHLEGAAGIAGLIKVVLSLQQGQIFPHLHFHTPNPYVDWETTPIRVPTKLTPWPKDKRIAGISSFGMSGTNAHIIIEGPADGGNSNAPEQTAGTPPVHLLTLSAKTPEALNELAQRYNEFLNTHTQEPLANICYTAGAGRSHFAHRLSIAAATRKEMQASLAAYLERQIKPTVHTGHAPTYQAGPKIAFLFTGQGSQYVNMGRELFDTHPVFRQTLQQCDEILGPYLGKSLLDILYPNEQSTIHNPQSTIDETAYTQPALFAVEYALAQLWQSWGIIPEIVMGHSIGELVAACIAGVFSLEDGLMLATKRGRLMQALPQDGEMVAVMADEARVNEAIALYHNAVSIAAVNGPQNVVISGKQESVQAITTALANDNIKTHKLTVSHAFHSPLMEPMLNAFTQITQQITYAPPKTALVSNVTGKLAGDEVTKPDYWVRHVREAVRFVDGITTLHEQGITAYVEIGPKPTLLGMAQQCLPTDNNQSKTENLENTRIGEEAEIAWLPTLRVNRGNYHQLLNSLSELYVRGATINWANFYGGDTHRRQRITWLPTYPFQRQLYWPNLKKKKQTGQSLSPLIDKMTKSPVVKDIIFETEFSVDALPFLADHQIQDTTIVASACHLALVLSAASVGFAAQTYHLEDIVFLEPLIVPEDGLRQVQLVCTPTETNGSSPAIDFQLISFDPEQEQDSSVHATGRLEYSIKSPPDSLVLDEVRDHCPEEIDPEMLYTTAEEEAGFIFGPTFRWMQNLWRHAPEANDETGWAALGKLRLPEAITNNETYTIHPGLLDACFQVAATANDITATGDLHLPFAVAALHLHRPITGNEWWCYARQTGEKEWHMLLTDGTGQAVAEITGFEMRAVPRSALQSQRLRTDWLYKVDWQVQPLPAADAEISVGLADTSDETVEPDGRWLIFGTEQGWGRALSTRLKAKDKQVVLIAPGEGGDAPSETVFVEPNNPVHFQEILTRFTEQNHSTIEGVVYLWGIDYPISSDTPTFTTQIYGGLLHLVQALTEMEMTPRLWIMTQNSRTVANAIPKMRIPGTDLNKSSKLKALQNKATGQYAAQGALWGLARTITMEYPQLACTCIDLESAGTDETVETTMKAVLAELTGPAAENEDQIAYRQGVRHVARLARWKPDILFDKDQPFQVRLTEYGSADNLHIVPMQRRAPQSDEVEVEVKVAGLNFRDVLNSLGLLAEYYAEYLNIHHAADVPLGFEYAGTVVAVGENITDVAVGDPVMGLASGSFANFITIPAAATAPIPAGATFEEAATIPLAFLTAWYGLKQLADIQPDERVLIHAAAGGVGQAAVQVAQAAGAEVFGTASLGKWDFLYRQGIKHVMNSRTLDFAQEVMTKTQNNGMDIVLNSLNADFVDRSFDVLRQGGRFVELGKLDIWSEEQAATQRPDAAYHLFDLGEEMAKNPDLLAQVWQELIAEFESGNIKPLPHTVFPVQRIADAFRFMQQAKHIGKIVISFDKPARPKIYQDATYLITGGLGALGLQIARQLVESGAGHLILTSRHGVAHDDVRETITQLEADGAKIEVVQADVSNREDVTRIIATAFPPLRGIVHAAGVLDDGVLAQQTVSRFETVMAPKVAGAWNLHTQTQNIPLDFFVCFSSIAAMLGSPGQGNYAAANAFMDSLMQQRRQMELPGLSINWGAWVEVGMAADLQARHQAQGLGAILPPQGRQIFDLLYNQETAQIGVLPINWAKLSQRLGAEVAPNFYAAFVKQVASAPGQSQPDLRPQLERASSKERRELLMTFMQQEVARVLGLHHPPDPHQEFMEMGMDSLMGVELRNRLQTALGLTLTATMVFKYSNIHDLVEHLAGQFDPETAETNESVGAGDDIAPRLAATETDLARLTKDAELSEEAVLSTLQNMDDEEINRLLHQMMAKSEEDTDVDQY